MHSDAISGIVDALDDCALRADRWPGVLDRLVTATGSRAAALVLIRGRTPGQLKTSGAEALDVSYFSGGWNKRDLRERGMWATGDGDLQLWIASPSARNDGPAKIPLAGYGFGGCWHEGDVDHHGDVIAGLTVFNAPPAADGSAGRNRR